jgi:hypothetical protein
MVGHFWKDLLQMDVTVSVQWLLNGRWYIIITIYFQLVTWASVIHGLCRLQTVLFMEYHSGDTVMQ